MWGTGVAGSLVERKRQLERERLKEGLKVWLERKACAIKTRKDKGAGVGVLVWRFSKRPRFGGASDAREHRQLDSRVKKDRVSSLKRFWESMGSELTATSEAN